MTRKSDVACVMFAILMSGCSRGGGSNGDDHGDDGAENAGQGNDAGTGDVSPPALGDNAAEGFYVGKLANGYSHRTFVLDNGQYYTIYDPDDGYIFAVPGLVQGSGQASNGTFTSSDLKDFYAVRAMVKDDTLTATLYARRCFRRFNHTRNDRDDLHKHGRQSVV